MGNLNNVYLSLQLRKSLGKTDANGNPYFEVEASNENLDLQNQIVLQDALLKSKDNFLKYGIISYDHLYKSKDADGKMVSDSHYIIGEPVDVYTEGKKTIVKGILYKSNELAKDLIEKLKDGSNRIRASVGGLWPKIQKDAKTGVEKIYEVLWNDLALTPTPVNNTVGAATLVKSMNPDEFMKALSTGGYGTDSANFTDGKALIPEDLGNSVDIEKSIKNDLLNAISNGEIKQNKEEMTRYLTDRGIESNLARSVIREIINNGGNSKMKKSDYEAEVDAILKSIGEEPKKENEPTEDDDFELELTADTSDNDDEEDDDDEEEDDDSMKKGCKKSLGDDEEFVDATDLIKSLRNVIKEQNETISDLQKSVADIGNAVVKVAQLTKSVAVAPTEPKSVLNKSINTGSNGGTPNGEITQEDFEQAQEVLMKSVQNNEISVLDSTKMESEIQRAKAGLCKISAKTYNFISSKINQ